MSVEDPRLSSISEENMGENFLSDIQEEIALSSDTSPIAEEIRVAQAGDTRTPTTGRVPADNGAPAAPTTPVRTEVTPDAGNIAHLPANVSIDDIKIEGADLVLVQADGTEIVIIGGAAKIPTMLIGEVEVQQQVLFAALGDSGINVAAGPDGSYSGSARPGSSGADFQDSIEQNNGAPITLASLLGDTTFGDGGPADAQTTNDGQPTAVSSATPFALSESLLADGVADNETITGQLIFDPGADNGVISSIAYTGKAEITSGGHTVAVTVSADGLTITGTITVGGVTSTVFTLHVTNISTGEFTFTQSLPLDHSGIGAVGANDILGLGFSFTVTDKDGDASTGTFTVNIADDGPSVGGSVTLASVNEDDLATGNDDGASRESLVSSASLNIDWGADNNVKGESAGDTFGRSISIDGLPQNLTSGGIAIVYGAPTVSANGTVTITAFQGANGPAVFTITLDPTSEHGTATFQLTGVLDHAAGSNTMALTFGFTATDADGDSVGGSFSISVEDDIPTVAANATVLLDDDALDGGNAGGNGDTVDSANATGVLAHSYGADGTGSVLWLSSGLTLPSGFTATVSANGTVLTISQGDRAVLQLTITDSATGAYDVKQLAQIDHPQGTTPGTEDNLAFTVSYQVTDKDGDTAVAPGTLTISVNDDIPTVSENATVLLDDDALDGGNAGGNGDDVDSANATGILGHSYGADGAGSVLWMSSGLTLPSGFSATVSANGTVLTISQGDRAVLQLTITNSVTGAYEVKQLAQIDHPQGTTPGTEDNLSFTVSYQATDKDGDTAATPGTLTINVDDDIPTVGENAIVRLDDDALEGGNPGGNGDEVDSANATGILSHSYGADGAGSVLWISSGLTLPTGFTATVSEGGTVLTISQGEKAVLQLTITNSVTGAYSVTQLAAIDHPQGTTPGLEDNLSFTVSYHATDKDGDTAATPGTLTVVVNDDIPTVGENAVVRLDDDALGVKTGGGEGGIELLAEGPIGYPGNPGGDGDDVDSANATGILAHSYGADGPGSVLWLSSGLTLPEGFSASVNESGTILTISQGEKAVLQLTITNTVTGAYSVTQLAAIDHQGSVPGFEDNVQFTVSYQVKDHDGDAAATPGTLTINVDDDTPTVSENATVLLDDDALTGGNAGGDGDDVDSANATGTLAHSYGADGPGSVLWLSEGLNLPEGFSAKVSEDGTIMTISQGNRAVLSLTITDTVTGAYEVKQLAPINHTVAGTEDNVSFTVSYQATDHDGDSAATPGTLTINVDDDTPTVGKNVVLNSVNEDDLLLGNDLIKESLSSSASLGVSWGADNAKVGDEGAVTHRTLSFNGLSDSLAGLTSNGYALQAGTVTTLANGGQTVTVYNTHGDAVFKLTLDPTTANGSVKFELLGNLDHHSGGANVDTLTLNFGFTAADSDGDTVNGGFSIDVKDDKPVWLGATNSTVEEENLPGGNEDTSGTGDADFRIPFIGTLVDVIGKSSFGTLGISWGADNANPSAGGTGPSDGSIVADRSVVFSGITEGSAVMVGGSQLTSDGKGVYYHLSADGQTLIGSTSQTGEGGTVVFTVALSDSGLLSAGRYDFTLNATLDHPAGNGENKIDLGFNFTATDSDGDSVNGSFTVSVLDDSPVQGTAVGSSLTEDDISTYPATDATPDVDKTKTDPTSLGISWGADDDIRGAGDTFGRTVHFATAIGDVGAATYQSTQASTIGLSFAGALDNKLTSGGVSLVYVITDTENGGQILTAHKGTATGATIFEVVLDPTSTNGSYTFELKGELDHAAGTDPLKLTFTFRGTDADGDAGNRATFVVQIADDAPVQGTVGVPAITLNEDNVSHYPATDGTPGNVTKTGATSLGISWGADDDIRGETNGDTYGRTVGFSKADGTIASATTTTDASLFGLAITGGTLTSGGESLVYTLTVGANGGQTLTAYIHDSTTKVFQIVLDPTTSNGSYTVEIFQELDHLENSNSATLSFNFRGTDADGDKAALGTATVTIADDQLVVGNPQSGEVDEDGYPQLVSGAGNPGPLFGAGDAPLVDTVTTRSLNISWGADDANKNVNGGYNGTQIMGDRSVVFGTNSVPSDLTSNGVKIVYELSANGTELTAYRFDGTHYIGANGENADAAKAGAAVFKVTLSDVGSGSYTFTLLDNIDHARGNEENNTDLNFQFVARDADGDAATKSFSVSIDDDTPVFTSIFPASGSVSEHNINTETQVTTGTTQSLNISWGADQGNAVVDGGTTSAQGDRYVVFNSNPVPNGLTSNGHAIVYEVTANGTLLTAYRFEGGHYVGVNGENLGTEKAGAAVFTVSLSDQNSGSFTFTLIDNLDHDGFGQGGTITLGFGFKAVDGDGDGLNGGFVVSINDDTPSLTSVANSAVDEDGLPGGNNGDTYASGDLAGNATSTGAVSLGVNWGADADLKSESINNVTNDPIGREVAFVRAGTTTEMGVGIVNNVSSYLGQTFANLTSDGASLKYVISYATDNSGNWNGGYVLTAYKDVQGGNTAANRVFTLTLDPTAEHGSYKFDLLGNLDHSVAGTEDDINLTFNFRATDSDGDSTGRGSFTVTVDDDAPVAQIALVANTALLGDETAGAQAGTDDQAGAVPAAFTAHSSLSSLTAIGWSQQAGMVTTTGSNYGADGAGGQFLSLTTASGGNFNGQDSGLTTLDGTHITMKTEGDVVIGRAGTVVVFALTIDSTGAVSMVQYQPIQHANGANPNDTSSLNGVYVTTTIFDREGDTTQATTTSQLDIKVQDDAPTVGTQTAVTVDEDGLSTGNGAYVAYPGDAATNSAVTVGAKLIYSFGTDGAADEASNIVFSTTNLTNQHLTSFGTELVYKWDNDTNTLTAKAGNAANAPVVFTLHVTNVSTGDYTFTLVRPLDHNTSSNGQNAGANTEDDINIDFQFTIKDGDGDTASGSVRVTIDDDAPYIGSPEAETVSEANLPYTGYDEANPDGGNSVVQRGNLDIHWGADNSNDNISPDISLRFGSNTAPTGLTSDGDLIKYSLNNSGTVLTAYTGNNPNANIVFTVSLSDSGSGQYTFRLYENIDHRDTQGNPVDTKTLSFNFTATDSDNDSASGSFSVTIEDTSPTIGTVENETVRENALPTDLGDVIFADTDGSTIQYGDLNINWGADDNNSGSANRSVTFNAALNGFNSGLTHDGIAIIYTLSNGGTELTAKAGNTTVFTVSLSDSGDGSYTFVLQDNIDHVGQNTGTNLPLTFGFTATDSDGDTATSAFTVTVIDDTVSIGTPVTGTVEEEELAGGNEDTSPGADEDTYVGIFNPQFQNNTTAVATGSLSISWGADDGNDNNGNPGDRSVVFTSTTVTTLNALGLTSEGKALTFTLSQGDTLLTATSSDGRAVFTVKLSDAASGSYTFTLKDTLDHNGAGEDLKNLSFSFRATDSDGDTASSSFAVRVIDDMPVQNGAATTNLTLDEDDLVGGNDVAPHESLSATGSLNVSLGADGGSYALSASGATWTAGTSTLQANDGSWKIVVAANGSYTFTLLDNTLAHGPADNGQNTLTIGVSYTATDGDGDSVSGNFNVRIVDDVPVTTAAVINQSVSEAALSDADPAYPSVSGSLSGVVSFGADGVGKYTVETTGLSASLTSLTSNGNALVYSVSGNTLVAKAGANGPTIFTLAVDQNTGEYTFTQQGPLDHVQNYTINGQKIAAAALADPGDTVSASVANNVNSGFEYVGRNADGEAIFRVTNGGNSTVHWTLDRNGSSADYDLHIPAHTTVYINAGSVSNSTTFDLDRIGNSGTNPPGNDITINANSGSSIPVAGSSTALTLDLSTAITVQDGDGDTLALSGRLNITVNDAAPTFTNTATSTVFEDGVKTSTSSLGLNWGGDNGPAKTLVLNNVITVKDQSGATISNLTSNGQSLNYTMIVGVLVAYIGNTIPTSASANSVVFTLSVDANTGNYAFDLKQPLDHTSPSGGEQSLSLTFSATATDADGDSANGSFSVKVDAAGELGSIHYDNLTTGVIVNLSGNAYTSGAQIVAGDTATDRASGNGHVVGIDKMVGVNEATGGSADDILIGGDEDNVLKGNGGNDILIGNGGNDTLEGGDGNDTLTGGLGADTLKGGAGDDIFNLGADISDATSYGPRNMVLGDGSIIQVPLTGMAGTSDNVEGGSGNDKVVLNAEGSTGFVLDLLNSGSTFTGVEEVVGTSGTDVILMRSDYMSDADGGGIKIDGGAGNDYIGGGAGSDTLIGGSGNDVISGLGGDDTIYGGDNDDTLWGGAGNDTIYGDAGNDTIIGGTGDDKLVGGAGNDTFIYTVGDGNDTVDGGSETGTTYPNYDTLVINGNDTAQNFTLGLATSGTDIVPTTGANSADILVSYAGGSVRADEIERVTFHLGSAGDTITVGNLTGSAIAPSTVVIDAGAGNDIIDLTGLAGTKVEVTGNDGIDTIKLAGVWTDYVFTEANGIYSVSKDGVVIATANTVEQFAFTGSDSTVDYTVNVDHLINVAPVAGDDENFVTEAGYNVAGISAAIGNLLANDTDANTEQGGGSVDTKTLTMINSTTVPSEGITIQGTYGSLLIHQDGSYTYTLDNDRAATQHLAEGQTVYENFGYTVADHAGLTDTGALKITVTGTNDAPVIAAITPIVYNDTAAADTFADVTGQVSSSDAEGDPITLSLSGAQTMNIAFGYDLYKETSFGTLYFNTVTGAYSFAATPAAIEALRSDQQVTFTISATDSHGAVSTQNIVVELHGANDTPVLSATLTSASYDDTASDDTFSSVSGSMSRTDRDSSDLALYGVTGGTASAALSGYDVAKVGDYGTLYVNSHSGAYQFVPKDGAIEGLKANTTETFHLTVTDVGGATDQKDFTVNITATNDKAEISGVAIGSVTETGSGLTVGVLTATGDLNSTDRDDANDSWTAVTTATASLHGYGTYTIDSTGHWTYALNDGNASVDALKAGETLTDTFKVTTIDGTEKEVTVTINGANDAPVVASAIADQTIDEDKPIDFTLPTGTFTDVDHNDTLSYTAKLSDGSALPSWLHFDAATQRFTGTPDANWNGHVDVTVTATDHSNATASDTFRITVNPVNDYPVANDDTLSLTVNQNAVTTFSTSLLLANDTDVDGDTLKVTDVYTTASGAIVTLNADGTISYDPTNVAILKQLSSTQTMTDEFTYRISDGHDGISAATVKLVVQGTNDAPVVASAIADQTINEEGSINFTVPAGTFTDIDNSDTLTYTATLANGSALPSWLHFNAATQSFTGTAPFNYSGYIDVTVTAKDGSLASASDTFSINVAPVADGVSYSASGTGNEGSTINFPVGLSFGDPGSEKLTRLEITGFPAGTTFSEGTLVNGVWVIEDSSGLNLLGLKITPPANYAGYISLELQGTTVDTAVLSDGVHTDSVVQPYYALVTVKAVDNGDATIELVDSTPGTGPSVGDTLTVNLGTDPDGGNGSSITYKWYRDGVLINGAGNSSYTLVAADSGHKINATASYTDGQNFSETVTSAHTATVISNNTPPVATNDHIYTNASDVGSGTSITVNHAWLLGNDTDAEGDDLSIRSFITIGNNLVVTSSGSNTGQMTLRVDIPNDGQDRNFAYTAYDGVSESNAAQVIVTRQSNNLTGSSGDDILIDTASFGSNTLNGGGGRDYIIGGAANNTIIADQTDYLIDGGAGNDTLQVAGGFVSASDAQIVRVENVALSSSGILNLSNQTEDLVITGSSGVDTITGGSGDDVIDGGGSDDVIDGGAGDDIIDGGNGDDTITGGSGDDVINGEGGADIITGGLGDDVLTGGSGVDTFNVDSGTDEITDLGNGGADIVKVSAGATAIIDAVSSWTASSATSNNGTASIDANGRTIDLYAATGTNGWTLTNSSSNSASITGSSKADIISGGSGADILRGGDGDDTLTGNGGNDTLVGGAGNDTFVVNSGTDTVSDLSGGDILKVSSSATAIATATTDWAATADTTNAGFPTINADGHNISVANAGGLGGWTLTNSGNATAVTLIGSARSDVITGGSGRDTLSGGAGDDIINGGGGGDILSGGTGSDRFVIASGDSTPVTAQGTSGSNAFRNENGTITGYDTITHWGTGGIADKLDFSVTVVRASTGTLNAGASTLTINGNAVESLYVDSNTGMTTFYSTNNVSGASQLSINSTSNLAAVVQYLVSSDIGNAGATLFFTGMGNTYVYQQTTNSAGGSLVQLTGITTLTDIYLGTAVISAIDPIVLDLDHNGFSFTSVADGAKFDINADGKLDQVAWTKTDAFLAFDANGNGKIDNGSELFTPSFNGGNHAGGVAALATLDVNHDGKIDASDTGFEKLVVWLDANGNGITEAGELTSLADHGITGISLDATKVDGYLDGQALLAQGTFTKADGSTGTFAEMGFDTIFGDGPDHVVTGGDGDDVLFASAGLTEMTGGKGADTFVLDTSALKALDMADVITDYKSGEGDAVDVSKLLDTLLGHQASEAEAVSNVRTTVAGNDTTISVQVAADSWKDVAVVQNHTEAVKILFDDQKHSTDVSHH